MGPLRDLQDMFSATLQLTINNHTTDSDQFYFANIWGDQEYARLNNDPARLQSQMKTVDVAERWQDPTEEPLRSPSSLVSSQRTEYYITLDYLSELFQTLAFYKQFLTWMRADHSWSPPPGSAYPGASRYQFTLPEDVKESLPPYADLALYNGTMTKAQIGLVKRTWQNIELCVNTVTKQVPVTLHFTGEKGLRAVWWEKIWFQKDGRLLQKASLATPERPLNGGRPIQGKVWVNGKPPGSTGDRSGAVGDNEEVLGWNGLCKEHENWVFDNHG